MRKMNLAEGSLILLGFILILNALVVKISGFNVLAPLIKNASSFLVAANTCFLIAFISAVFGKSEEK